MLRVCGVLLIFSLHLIDCHGFSNEPRPLQNDLLRPKRARISIMDGIFARSNYSTTTPGYQPTATVLPDSNSDLTLRLNRLESEFDEKVTKFRHELHHRSYRIESENAATKSEVERLKKDLERMRDQQRRHSENVDTGALENGIEDLKSMVKVMLSGMRILNADIANIKKNLSGLATQTELMAQSNVELVTKEFFNQGLLDLQHKQNRQLQSPQQNTDNILPKNCKEIKDNSGDKSSGIYRIKPDGAPNPFMVFCEMDSRDGGWTVIQNRYDGSQEFLNNYFEYKHGFGNIGGEFWLGLDNIYYLTGHEVNELLIELEDFNGVSTFARYAAFSLGSELEGYALKVLGGYSGNAGDSLIYHAGNKFSTKDIDNDAWPEGNCALSHGGGWWYRSCDTSNLNGRYLNGKLPEQFIYQGMYWADFGGPLYSLRKARILVRPRDERSPPMFDNKFNSNSTFDDY